MGFLDLVPWPYRILVIAAAIAGAYATGRIQQAANDHRAAYVKGIEVQSAHQLKTIEVLNHAAETKPVFAPAPTIVERVRAATCPRLPEPADNRPAVGPAGAEPAPAQSPDVEHASELVQCVQLAHDYDTLRALWHANEAVRK